MSSVLHLQAPAKINLVLRVLSQRADGYHELETWMQKLDLFDELRIKITPGTGISFTCRDSEIPEDESNLAWRAAASFLAASKKAEKFAVDIELVKNIPSAAGLGGGSSDAGTVLKGLNSFFNNEFSQEELISFGKEIGADVPFFVTDYPSVIATGIGDIMKPVPPLTDVVFVLVNPGISVSTKWVFENFALTIGKKNFTLTGSHGLDPEMLALSDIINDLEPVTTSRYPEIAARKETLKAAGAEKVLMSGSGPTVFGVFPDTQKNQQEVVANAVNLLQCKYKDKVFVTRAHTGV